MKIPSKENLEDREVWTMWCVRVMGEGQNDSTALQVGCNWSKISEKNAQEVHILKDPYDFTKNLVKSSLDQLRNFIVLVLVCFLFFCCFCCLFCFSFFVVHIDVATDWLLIKEYTHSLHWFTGYYLYQGRCINLNNSQSFSKKLLYKQCRLFYDT